MDDNLYAYIVPLIEVGKGEIGYITIGAIEDGYDSYQIFIDDNIMNNIRHKLGKHKNPKLVFIPTMTYILKAEDENDDKYFNISNNDESEIDVTKNVIEKREEIKKRFGKIRSEENRKQIQKTTKKLIDVNTNVISLATIIPEDVRLVNEAEGSFVPVNDNGKIRYGGNQNWWSGTKASRGCGPTAAANITCYLARKKSTTKYVKLYSQASMNKSDFLKHMDALYSYIDPGILGAFYLPDWASNVERYAKDKGVTLSRVTSSASFTLDNTATYIKNGLNADSPVATLDLQWPNTGYAYAWHWMTITKYYRDSLDNRWIAVSTWGGRVSINYKTHFNSINSWDGGFMYFK